MKVIVALISVGLAAAPVAQSQQRALLDAQAANQLIKRTVQLMESTTVAIPELVRAGARCWRTRQAAAAGICPASTPD
jgi:hypothetical protein